MQPNYNAICRQIAVPDIGNRLRFELIRFIIPLSSRRVILKHAFKIDFSRGHR